MVCECPLKTLDSKLQLIRDRVQGVAEKYSNGFYLWGPGGTSKSYCVEKTLESLGNSYKLTNSRLTAKGLFELLRDYPDSIHVLEDMETLFRDKNSAGVLRSALWGQVANDGRQERNVVWQTAGTRHEFVFTGGIILVANAPIENLPELQAVKTRIAVLKYDATNDEIAALMREICEKGHRHGGHFLEPADCLEVAEAIVERTTRIQRNLDLRLLIQAFQDRLQWANGAAETHWLDLVDSRIKERAISPVSGGVRAEKKEKELELVRGIAHLPRAERLKAWKEATGKSEPALYRRMTDLGILTSHQDPKVRDKPSNGTILFDPTELRRRTFPPSAN
jgi:hypothetical protein